MEIEILKQKFAVCKIKDSREINFEDDFLFAGKTDEEFSVVCVEEKVYKSAYAVDKGWKALRIKEILDFSLVGILYKISKILAENNIGIFAVSTYNTDYILVKEENINKASEKLDENGYKISKL